MSLNIQRDVSLQSRSGMATPAVADYLVEVQTLEQIAAALDFAEWQGLSTLVLGEGSNTVFTQDYSGLVIVNKLTGIEVTQQDLDSVFVAVAAGENWHHFVEYSLVQNWYGLENLALIPGSVGAAPMQNIGAYGVEVKSFIESVSYLDTKSREVVVLPTEQCQFAYRDSVFKHKLAGRAVIIEVKFRLIKTPNINTSYSALEQQLKSTDATPQAIFELVCQIRSAKLPLPTDIPNCGSFFKNPIVSHSQREALLAKHSDLVSFKFGAQYKLAAAWLIERLGWKNRALHGVIVHKSQSLVITNPVHASGSTVLEYAKGIQKEVLREYDVELEIEPRLV